MLLVFQLALFGLASSASIKFILTKQGPVPITLVDQGTDSENESLPMEKCWPLMEYVGLTARFPGAVSHAIHSLTLEDLRHYFDPQAQGSLSQTLSNSKYIDRVSYFQYHHFS